MRESIDKLMEQIVDIEQNIGEVVASIYPPEECVSQEACYNTVAMLDKLDLLVHKTENLQYLSNKLKKEFVECPMAEYKDNVEPKRIRS